MFEREYRELSFVPRWSVQRTIRKQYVDGHSFYVILYSQQLADILQHPMEYRADLVKWATVHDAVEAFQGDWPGPAKRAMIDKDKALKFEHEILSSRFGPWIGIVNKSHGIREIVKCADLLDEMFFLCTDYQLGNMSIGHPLSGLSDEAPNAEPVNTFQSVGRRLIAAYKALYPFVGVSPDEAWRIFNEFIHPAIRRAYSSPSRVYTGSDR